MLIVVHRKNHDLTFGLMPEDLSRSFHSVQPRQTDVHQNDLRAALPDELNGVRTILGLADHAKFAGAVQDGLDAIAHDLVIIHEEDVEWHNEWKQLYLFPSCMQTRAPA